MCKKKKQQTFQRVMLLLFFVFRHDVYDRLSLMTLTQNTTAWPNVRKFLDHIAVKHPNGLVGDIGL